MTTRKAPGDTQQFSKVRVAPLGELNAYTVYEHELDIIAAGTPAALAFDFDFAVALISIGITFILTLTTTAIASDRLFYGYLISCINCPLLGFIMLVYWARTRKSVDMTVVGIKSRLIVPEPIQERLTIGPPGPPGGVSG